jgi:hypothetical protein
VTARRTNESGVIEKAAVDGNVQTTIQVATVALATPTTADLAILAGASFWNENGVEFVVALSEVHPHIQALGGGRGKRGVLS